MIFGTYVKDVSLFYGEKGRIHANESPLRGASPEGAPNDVSSPGKDAVPQAFNS